MDRVGSIEDGPDRAEREKVALLVSIEHDGTRSPTPAQADGPTVLVVINDQGSGPRGVPAALGRHGVGVDVRDATVEPLPPSVADYAGLVLLGGGLMPDDDATAHWLPDERRLAVEALRGELPVLGICLGAQLLAYVAGGRVQADGPNPERGVTRIELSHDADSDRVLADVPRPAYFVENHRDVITELPAGATLLASSQRCPIQAFRLGSNCWGVQFHPEVQAERALEFDPARLAGEGFDPQEIAAEAGRRADDVRAAGAAVLEGFGAVVAEQARRCAAAG